jgi:hypothetical protein
VVVRGDRREPVFPGGVNRLLEPRTRERFVSELHQRQVESQIHESIVSDFAGGASNPGRRARIRRALRLAVIQGSY